MKILYFDAFSGMSGDMTVGALLDAGGSFNGLQEQLKKLPLDDEYELTKKQIVKNGITSVKFDVILKQQHTEKGNGAGHTHANQDDADQNHHHHHSHEHGHDHGHVHSHHHHHRTYQDIVNMIRESDLSENVKEMSLRIFKKIGEAEGKIHGVPLDEVHFHEVGAVDSIIDIVGTAILIDELDIEAIYCAPIPTGSGSIHIDHGIYPVPAPATLEILKGVPLAESELKAELTTPTGAAIAAVLANSFSQLPAMRVTSVGYGAGTKTFPEHPNVLRVVVGEAGTE